MSTIILNFRVKDYSQWRPIYDSDEKRRTGAGWKNSRVLRKAADPNHVYLYTQVENPGVIEKMMSDPELQKIMHESGVIDRPDIVVLNEA